MNFLSVIYYTKLLKNNKKLTVNHQNLHKML